MASITKTYRFIFKHLLSYLSLFITSIVVIYAGIIPLFTLIGSIMLRLAGVRYLSNTNFVEVVTNHPFLDIGCLLLILAVIVAIYWQVTFLFLGIMQINQGKKLALNSLITLSFQRVRHTFGRAVGYLLIYCLIILPFGGLGISTPLLNKVRVPDFIINYFLYENRPLLLVLILLYLVTFYLGIRFFLALPLIILGRSTGHQAVQKSWRLTKLNFKTIVKQLGLLIVVNVGLSILGQALILALQALADHHLPASWDYWAASINLLLIELVLLLMSIALGTGSLMIMADQLKNQASFVTSSRQLSNQLQRLSYQSGKHWWFKALAGVLFLGILGFNALYLNGFFTSTPLTISHRGVNAKNGVQNTIPALINTSRLHPDFIEMDLHETKDHQFVVMHDENLKQLTGVNKRPHDLTLRQITRLTARENGTSAKIASFDDYLATAERLHQRLLVELKTTKRDSSNSITTFNKRYGKRLVANHDEVHSLDYDAVEKLKTLNPKLQVGYILPFNFIGVPQSKADFYTMEHSTLNNSFLITAQLTGRKVYAWTVNDRDVMAKLTFMGVNGIITDNLETLQRTIQQLNHHPNYVSRLLNFTVELG